MQGFQQIQSTEKLNRLIERGGKPIGYLGRRYLEALVASFGQWRALGASWKKRNSARSDPASTDPPRGRRPSRGPVSLAAQPRERRVDQWHWSMAEMTGWMREAGFAAVRAVRFRTAPGLVQAVGSKTIAHGDEGFAAGVSPTRS
jgi:hypothetical protein